MFLVSSCSCLIHGSQVFSREWRCSWSSAYWRCSNYIWVINKCIAYWDATYIRGLKVCGEALIAVLNLFLHLISDTIYDIEWGKLLQSAKMKYHENPLGETTKCIETSPWSRTNNVNIRGSLFLPQRLQKGFFHWQWRLPLEQDLLRHLGHQPQLTTTLSGPKYWTVTGTNNPCLEQVWLHIQRRCHSSVPCAMAIQWPLWFVCVFYMFFYAMWSVYWSNVFIMATTNNILEPLTVSSQIGCKEGHTLSICTS